MHWQHPPTSVAGRPGKGEGIFTQYAAFFSHNCTLPMYAYHW